MKLFSSEKLQSKVSFVWKILLVLILCMVILSPTPAWAYYDRYTLEDYREEAQNYISNVKTQLDGVITSVKKLPTLSYADGQETLIKIDGDLQKIQGDVGEKNTEFKNLSDEAQKDYEKYLDVSKKISKIGEPPLEYVKNVGSLYVRSFERDYDIRRDIKYLYAHVINRSSEDRRQLNDDVLNGRPCQQDRSYYPYACDALETAFSINEVPKLIVFSNKVSNFYDDLGKRINLVRQKALNVKDYVKELHSFSDSNVVGEINELDNFIADLTKKLPNAI